MIERAISSNRQYSDKNLNFNNARNVKQIYFARNDQKEPKNLYYHNSPYYGNHNQTFCQRKGVSNISRISSISETNSQKSTKEIRANGSKLAQKPRGVKDPPERLASINQDNNNKQIRQVFDQSIQLLQQNRILRQQNYQLRQNLRIKEQMHKNQVQNLNIKFSKLLKKAEQLEKELLQEESDCKKKQDCSYKKSLSPKLNSGPSINSINSINTTPKNYNSSLLLPNGFGYNNIRK